MNDEAEVAICLPMRREVNCLSVDAIMRMCLTSVCERPTEILTELHAHLLYARNNLAKKALNSMAKYFLWIDDDAVPPADAVGKMLDTLVEKDADVVSCLCIARTGKSPASYMQDVNKENPKKVENVQDSRWIFSTGFHGVLMKREVLEKVSEYCWPDPIFQTPVNARTHEFIGEDRYFWACLYNHAQHKDNPPKIWHAAEIKFGHVMQTIV